MAASVVYPTSLIDSMRASAFGGKSMVSTPRFPLFIIDESMTLGSAQRDLSMVVSINHLSPLNFHFSTKTSRTRLAHTNHCGVTR